MPDFDLEKIMRQLWRPVEAEVPVQLYAILDSARDEKIYSKLLKSDIEVVSLYRGDPERELAEVAPYLIKLQRIDPFNEWFLKNGWGKSWGIFFESSATMKELRQHLRIFLMVYDEEANPLYFRYYDPRVFRIYLPTCDQEEMNTVFGPIRYYAMEDEDPNFLLRFWPGQESPMQEKILVGKIEETMK